MDDEDRILEAMAQTISSANIDDPIESPGVERGQHYHPFNESLYLAKAALRGLQRAGYTIVRQEAETP